MNDMGKPSLRIHLQVSHKQLAQLRITHTSLLHRKILNVLRQENKGSRILSMLLEKSDDECALSNGKPKKGVGSAFKSPTIAPV
jgi:hypothetical protein